MKIGLFILLIVISQIVFCQSIPIEYILKSDVDLVERVNTEDVKNKMFLECQFGSAKILNSAAIKLLNGCLVTKIELVFTTHSRSLHFNQEQLNRKRLVALKKLSAELYNNELIEWKIIGQTACNSASNTKDFFHGFIITYRPEPTEIMRLEEIAYMKSIFGTDSTSIPDANLLVDQMPTYKGGEAAMYNYLKRSISYPDKAIVSDIEGKVYVSFMVNEEGNVSDVKIIKGIGGGCDEEAIRVVKTMPQWNAGMQKGKVVSVRHSLIIEFSLSDRGQIDYIEKSRDLPIADSSYVKVRTSLPLKNNVVPEQFVRLLDSSVLKILYRNVSWNKISVVCDFTSSMYPYTSQLMIWHKLNVKANSSKVQLFTFFNDGDRKLNSQKPIGNAGGIYQRKADNYEEVQDLSLETMRNGIGGIDIPENNLEAILEAIKQCPDCDDIVMIADNFATPRDISLLPKINKPIKIILCGTSGGINPAYLDIAKQTKGSIHTIENDIISLAELNDGEEIMIENKYYKISDGKFIRIYKL